MPAIPGFKPPIKGVCVVPQGMEEGSEHVLEGQEFGLITGQEAEFRFLSSEVRSGDDDPDRERAHVARDLGDERRRSRPGAAPHSGRHEDQVGPFQRAPHLVFALGERLPSDLRAGAGTEPRVSFLPI